MSSGRSKFFFDTFDISYMEDSRVTESGDTNEDDEDIVLVIKPEYRAATTTPAGEKGRKRRVSIFPTLFSSSTVSGGDTPPR